MKHRLSVATLVSAVALAACGDSGSAADSRSAESATETVAAAGTPAVQLVDVPKALQLTADPSIRIIDVRTPEEFAEGHIERAELFDFNAGGFSEQIAELDRGATYFVYCRSGNRSGQATAIMAELGFTHVYDLDGGIVSWLAAGAPTVV